MDLRKSGSPSGLELPAEEMRRLGHHVVDVLVDRWISLGEGPAWQGKDRSELEPLLAEDPPEEGRDPDRVLERLLRDVLPWAGRIDHPRIFAFIPSSPTWPSVLGDLLATGFNVFQGTWLESAGPSQVELVVLDWFRNWLGFPSTGGGLLTSGGSAATLIALVTAREWGGNRPDSVVYVSDQGHSSLERGARIMGVPGENVRKIPTDRAFRMEAEALRAAIREDRRAGKHPLLVCANAGATNTGAVDPLDSVGAVAREEGVWFHVDGAYGGFAILTPGGRRLFSGIEEADSVTLDPHKWLFQPYETGCLMVRDTGLLEDAFRILPEYLQDVELGLEHVNFADRGVQLTRQSRALKIWTSVQMLGLRAFKEAIERGIELAARAETYVQDSSCLEILAPASLGVVCFRFRRPGLETDAEELERLNRAIQDEIVTSGLAMMSSTRLRGVFSLRMIVMNYRSTWEDVERTLRAVETVGMGAAETVGLRAMETEGQHAMETVDLRGMKTVAPPAAEVVETERTRDEVDR